ncbi:protein MANBAL isoform X1 [Bos taurus]|uniref:protein MANBAL isoform X1 n=1 Tax=Bos taurus TaxID=9913 RepID=UPI000D5355D1|nr:protein MANBAL isoform X1 [Bos taurus]
MKASINVYKCLLKWAVIQSLRESREPGFHFCRPLSSSKPQGWDKRLTKPSSLDPPTLATRRGGTEPAGCLGASLPGPKVARNHFRGALRGGAGGGRTIRAPKCRGDEETQGHCSFCKQETQEGGEEEAVEGAAFAAWHEGPEGSPPVAHGLKWLGCPVTTEIWTILTVPGPRSADHHFFLLPS